MVAFLRILVCPWTTRNDPNGRWKSTSKRERGEVSTFRAPGRQEVDRHRQSEERSKTRMNKESTGTGRWLKKVPVHEGLEGRKWKRLRRGDAQINFHFTKKRSRQLWLFEEMIRDCNWLKSLRVVEWETTSGQKDWERCCYGLSIRAAIEKITQVVRTMGKQR